MCVNSGLNDWYWWKQIVSDSSRHTPLCYLLIIICTICYLQVYYYVTKLFTIFYFLTTKQKCTTKALTGFRTLKARYIFTYTYIYTIKLHTHMYAYTVALRYYALNGYSARFVVVHRKPIRLHLFRPRI